MSFAQNRLLSINNYFYPRGGAEVLFLEQNRLFEGIGWDVVPFAMRHANNLPTAYENYFPDEIEFGRDYSLARKLLNAQRVIYSRQARSKLGNLLDRARPTIAHAHNIYHHLSPSVLPLLRERGVPTVMTVHDLKLGCPAYTMMRDGRPCDSCKGGRLYNVAVHRCIKGSLALSGVVMAESYIHRWLRLYEANIARFVVPSRFVMETLIGWGWPRERFVHVPNFVDVARFRPDEPIGTRFVYCGRLERLKGVETLVRAAARSGQPLTLAGRGPDETQLRELTERLGADVRFLGHVSKDELADVLQTARAVVAPSECNENAPLAVLEAYAAGRPVIGARIAGIPELVREGETGSLVASGDVEALADELARYAALPDARLARMGAAGRAWVERDFTAAAYRDRLVALYSTLTPGVAA
ncbi:glycosyltransferase family 4 protein [Methylobacterium planeticum]|uniref:Glycosyltransferase family 4 protein n=1 Tax=Methylobacterium planeticum TaxID=2615211 RepID=A0A6N6MXV2_9HYPH|nr:glycosyltransferase family 4 protein [Methylobacterium planeticum]KAB1074051.1 glycosyltransferase family 4 protein [Methylobacterium planeticum]